MIGKKIFILFFSFFLLISCQPKPGIMRESFEKYHVEKFISLGFSIELPSQPTDQYSKYKMDIADSDIYKKNSNSLGEVYVMFHPIYGTHWLSEPIYLIELGISRLSKEQFESFMDGNHYLTGNPCYQKIPTEFSKFIINNDVTDTFNRREYQCFYQTKVFPNGDVLVCLGRILLEDQSNLEGDIQQLRSIMNSITIL